MDFSRFVLTTSSLGKLESLVCFNKTNTQRADQILRLHTFAQYSTSAVVINSRWILNYFATVDYDGSLFRRAKPTTRYVCTWVRHVTSSYKVIKKPETEHAALFSQQLFSVTTTQVELSCVVTQLMKVTWRDKIQTVTWEDQIDTKMRL